jgi:hypothetical protein
MITTAKPPRLGTCTGSLGMGECVSQTPPDASSLRSRRSTGAADCGDGFAAAGFAAALAAGLGEGAARAGESGGGRGGALRGVAAFAWGALGVLAALALLGATGRHDLT